MTGSAWFTLSLGRKHRAEPKWLLPMICKAGNITRDDVGSIKIFDEETRFQISAAKAAEYAETVARNGSGENNVTIAPAGAKPSEEAAASLQARLQAGVQAQGQGEGLNQVQPRQAPPPHQGLQGQEACDVRSLAKRGCSR